MQHTLSARLATAGRFWCEQFLTLKIPRATTELTFEQSFFEKIQSYQKENSESAATILRDWHSLESQTKKLAIQIYKRGPSNFNGKYLIAPVQLKSEDWLNLEIEKDESRFYICDSGFLNKHPQVKECLLRAKIPESVFFWSPTEAQKNCHIVELLISKLEAFVKETKEKALKENLRAESIQLVSLGGGINSDVTGFLAGLFNAPYHVVPTTLLSAVDAAFGGKTGVNSLSGSKNQIGMFWGASSLTLIPSFLQTCTPSQLRAGLAEALKHSWLSGNLQPFENLLETFLAQTNFQVAPLLAQLEFKCAVVLRDSQEIHERKLLNFGHTCAHVWESLAHHLGKQFEHGHCVAWGMWAASKMMQENNMLDREELALHRKLQKYCGLLLEESELLTVSLEELEKLESTFQSLSHSFLLDKKNQTDNTVTFVLPQFGIWKHLAEDEECSFQIRDNSTKKAPLFLKNVSSTLCIELFLACQSEILAFRNRI